VNSIHFFYSCWWKIEFRSEMLSTVYRLLLPPGKLSQSQQGNRLLNQPRGVVLHGRHASVRSAQSRYIQWVLTAHELEWTELEFANRSWVRFILVWFRSCAETENTQVVKVYPKLRCSGSGQYYVEYSSSSQLICFENEQWTLRAYTYATVEISKQDSKDKRQLTAAPVNMYIHDATLRK